MNRKLCVRIFIDIGMTVCLLLLMPYSLLGETAHEWIGMGMCVLFVMHHVLNRRWMASIAKGRYTLFRAIQTLLVVVMSLHLGIHWNMIVSICGRLSGGPSVVRTWIARGVAVLVAGYGAYAFDKRQIAKYLSMKMHFAFYDFSEPVLFFIWDYVAVMVMIAFIAYYMGKRLRKAER